MPVPMTVTEILDPQCVVVPLDATTKRGAIDALVDKLDRLVKKRKEKTTDHHAEEGRRARH